MEAVDVEEVLAQIDRQIELATINTINNQSELIKALEQGYQTYRAAFNQLKTLVVSQTVDIEETDERPGTYL